MEASVVIAIQDMLVMERVAQVSSCNQALHHSLITYQTFVQMLMNA